MIGAMVGIVGSLLVSPRMMLTPMGQVGWLLAWPLLGMIVGGIVAAWNRPGRPSAGS